MWRWVFLAFFFFLSPSWETNYRHTAQNAQIWHLSKSAPRKEELTTWTELQASPASGARYNSQPILTLKHRNPRRAGYLPPLPSTDSDQNVQTASNKRGRKREPWGSCRKFLDDFSLPDYSYPDSTNQVQIGMGLGTIPGAWKDVQDFALGIRLISPSLGWPMSELGRKMSVSFPFTSSPSLPPHSSPLVFFPASTEWWDFWHQRKVIRSPLPQLPSSSSFYNRLHTHIPTHKISWSHHSFA